MNLGAPHRSTIRDESRVLRTSWMMGPQSSAIVNEPLAETHMVGATFHPAGGGRWLGAPMPDLAGRSVDLDALFGPRADELRCRLYETRGPGQKLACLESALAGLAAPRAYDRSPWDLAVGSLARSTRFGVSHIARDMGFSAKHVIAQVKQAVGLTPRPAQASGRLRPGPSPGPRDELPATDGDGDGDGEGRTREVNFFQSDAARAR